MFSLKPCVGHRGTIMWSAMFTIRCYLQCLHASRDIRSAFPLSNPVWDTVGPLCGVQCLLVAAIYNAFMPLEILEVHFHSQTVSNPAWDIVEPLCGVQCLLFAAYLQCLHASRDIRSACQLSNPAWDIVGPLCGVQCLLFAAIYNAFMPLEILEMHFDSQTLRGTNTLYGVESSHLKTPR